MRGFFFLLILESSERAEEINIDPMNMKTTSQQDRKHAAEGWLLAGGAELLSHYFF